MNVLTEKWIVIDGSIYTERAEAIKSEATGKLMANPQRSAIAYNVGARTATHIVAVHNAGLNKYEAQQETSCEIV